jgi:hypothetical protein
MKLKVARFQAGEAWKVNFDNSSSLFALSANTTKDWVSMRTD